MIFEMSALGTLIFITLCHSSWEKPSGPLNTFQEKEDIHLINLRNLNPDAALVPNTKTLEVENVKGGTPEEIIEVNQEYDEHTVVPKIAEKITEYEEQNKSDVLEEVEIIEDVIPVDRGDSVAHTIIRRQSIDYQEGLDYDTDLLTDVERISNPYYTYFIGRKKFRPLFLFGG